MAIMRSLYDRLFKILKHEQSKGFANTAVIGGLESFLNFWLTEARKTASTPQEREQVEEVATQLGGYSGLSPADRTQRVQYLFERLGTGMRVSPPKPTEGGVAPQQVRADTNPPDERSAGQRQPNQSRPPQGGNSRPPQREHRDRRDEPRHEPRGNGGRPETQPREEGTGTPRTNDFGRVRDQNRRDERGERGNKRPFAETGVTPPLEGVPAEAAAPGEPRETFDRSQTKAATPPAARREQPRGRGKTFHEEANAPSKPKLPPFQRRQWSPEEMQRLDRDLDRLVTTVPGIGASKADKYARMGITTVRDLLYHVPFRYEDYTTLKQIAELMYGDEVTVAGVVQDVNLFKTPRGTVTVTAKIGDGTGIINANWFGNKYLVNQLGVGTMLRLSGKVEAYLGKLQLRSPRFESVDAEEMRSGRLVAIYPRTEGITEKMIIGDAARALEHVAGKIPDPLPLWIREQYDLPDLGQALRWIHQPQNQSEIDAARKRLAFDELLRLQLGLLQQRRVWRSQQGVAMTTAPDVMERFHASLPFQLTGAQQRSLTEILHDMAQPYSMSRLLQGDVGSGKTAVAAAALLKAVAGGYQGALMAPTEILAEQHFKGLTRFLNPESGSLLGDRPIRVAMLTGSMTQREKEETRQAIAEGTVDVVIGTHALIQQEVTFHKLGLAVVDEQHRFGVQQRGALRSAQETAPDLLVMSATPIPRSLALTLYGDLDLSLIDELPPGREPIVTRAIATHQRERAYTYIRRQLMEGRQAFIICPLVEESDKLEAKAAVDEHRFLQTEVFPDFQVELLHGRMRPDDKEDAMGRFYRNESQVLVSTSVVEVGIDVPNATVMLIEGANRFGLAQLHQFRGRIGRGSYRSLCLLMAEETISADGEHRLNALVENSDGFKLAEEDLAMRGPGDFFGTKQSGLPVLKLAQLGDSASLHAARTAAADLLAKDPDLAHPDHQVLRSQKERYWAGKSGNLS